MSDVFVPRIGVIVVAAGSGTRLAMEQPKAFVELSGQTLLARALHSVFGMLEPAQVVIVAPQTHLAEARVIGHAAAGLVPDLITVVPGGETRHASVEAGLAALGDGVSVVLVHDSARALTPSSLMDAVVVAVDASGDGVVPALALVDSIKRVGSQGEVLEVVDRSDLAAAQTPQGFPRAALVRAYQAAAHAEYTDDAAVFAAAGNRVHIVTGDALAFKVTTVWDLNRAEHLVKESVTSPEPASRVGIGVDVHAFGETENLWLAGLHWPGERQLSGHSDGDAVAHALCDALLSAAGLGDIGGIFGTAAPEFANARGEVFVRETVRLLAVAGWEPVHASVQIVGNRPKFAPRRVEAEGLLTQWVGAPVSLSATTTDGLGFTGRGEGIAALATALVRSRTPR
jgi:2-C-methyl-D-erythritol 4-phosphate cytidylyltransferase/2-C-methyl-D-erythritol 2,4-cyclodiphosphate synthase